MKIFLSILLIFSFCFMQEPCVGECFSNEEVQNIELHITTLEQKDSLSVLEITNLKDQIKLFEAKSLNDSLWLNLQTQKIDLLDRRIVLYNDLIKEIEPKWYENKWLWFGLGIFVTTTAVDLAGQIN